MLEPFIYSVSSVVSRCEPKYHDNGPDYEFVDVSPLFAL